MGRAMVVAESGKFILSKLPKRKTKPKPAKPPSAFKLKLQSLMTKVNGLLKNPYYQALDCMRSEAIAASVCAHPIGRSLTRRRARLSRTCPLTCRSTCSTHVPATSHAAGAVRGLLDPQRGRHPLANRPWLAHDCLVARHPTPHRYWT